MSALTVIYLLILIAGAVGFVAWLRQDARMRRDIRDIEQRIQQAREGR